MMFKKAVFAPESIPSERLNLKYHLYVLIFEVLKAEGSALRYRRKEDVLSAKVMIDLTFIFVRTLLDKMDNEDEIRQLKKKLDKDKNTLNTSFGQYDYMTRLNTYLEMVMQHVKRTGLLSPQDILFLQGGGKVTDDSTPHHEFPNPRPLNITKKGINEA